MKTTIKVYTKPIPKARPRLYKGKVYTPKKTHDYEELISSNFLIQSDKDFGENFVKIKILFEIEVPKSYSQKKRSEALRGILRPSKNDLDNLVKSVLDGLNGVAFKDDRQVCIIEAEKKFAEQNCVTITIQNIMEWLNGKRKNIQTSRM